MDSKMDVGGVPLNVETLKQLAFSPVAIVSLVGIWLGYRILVALYNISPLHPLSRFPGPKIAAVSYVYEAYYDWICEGQYTNKIRQMHERYGPIVRINPDELHCSDPLWVDEIYTGTPGRIRDKWQHQLNTGGAGPVSVTGFSTVPHELHRLRKGALSKFFSRPQMLKLEGEVLDFAEMTVNKMLRWSGKEAFDIKEALNCFTADVISQYAFGDNMGFVAQEDWTPNLATYTESFLKSAYMMRHFTPGRKMTNILPFFADYLGEDVKRVMNWMNVVIPGYITAAINDPENGRIFSELVRSKALPAEEMSMYRLSGEGFNFLLAGTETTAATLTTITFWLLAQPDTYRKLMKDLEGLTPETLKWTELEKRPYMWAVVHEALRMMPGVSQRIPRRAREEELVYTSKDGKTTYVIPRNTPIGMSAVINHYDEDLFPKPHEFIPERFIVDGEPNRQLAKYLMAFGKGTRSCLGENLAYCELYIMTALLAMRVVPRARLVDTTYEMDMKYDHDAIVPQVKNGACAARIKID
ncbi:putative cytochrome P450 E-class, group IV [Podospora fimiseda]|uniref:Cytochrome P450 E-class, group IV n=1 Tax=Podospora fimiseda TaxID=252190 RepID=A0AAN7BSC6_9PEZI|nr:putative cytochrome P450 E-class, group IV [Podospora fimiseda]